MYGVHNWEVTSLTDASGTYTYVSEKHELGVAWSSTWTQPTYTTKSLNFLNTFKFKYADNLSHIQSI